MAIYCQNVWVGTKLCMTFNSVKRMLVDMNDYKPPTVCRMEVATVTVTAQRQNILP
jgi:hypothetical protein